MENRFQYVLLIILFVASTLPLSAIAQSSSDIDKLNIRTEFIELGVSFGVMNIEDFGSEFALGTNLTFRATEDFFLQLNYMKADDVALSSVEESQGPYFSSANRDFEHYDLLLGYNLFQGEFFTRGSKADLSSFYTVAGVGETEFGGESNFTYTLGLGYQVAFNRRFIVRLDMRDYFYKSSLITEDNTTNNFHFSTSISYFF